MPTAVSDAEDSARQLRDAGWCVLSDLIPDQQVDLLCQAVLQQEAEQRREWQDVLARYSDSGRPLPPRGVGHAQAMVNHAPLLASVCASPRIMEPVSSILGQGVRVASTSGLVNFPGNERGYWHADWPYNQNLATCVRPPYGDMAMQLSAILMLTEFSPHTGATWILPGSHRLPDNPTSSDSAADRARPRSGAIQACGAPGSMLLYDSRLWHAAGANHDQRPRLAVTIRYAPWWLNLEVRRQGSPDFQRLAACSGGKNNSVPTIPRRIFEMFDEAAKPLFMHWLDQ